MKLRHWVLGISSCMLVAGAVGAGCGSTETTNPATSDGGGGSDAVTDNTSVKDVAKDVPADTQNSCFKDADFTQIPIPDASINDGGTNTGACASCARTNCATEAQQCANDCECNNFVIDFFACVGRGGALIQCGGALLTLPASSRAAGQGLVTCVIGSCSSACGVPNLGDGGGDANEGG